MNTFLERKELILSRARSADACTEQYRRAYRAETDAEMLSVVADNFSWCSAHKVIDLDLLKAFPEEQLTQAGIYLTGYHVHTEGRHFAYGNATVEAYGNATVEAYGNATVRAYGNATVRADGNATVEAYGQSNVYIYNGKACVLNGFSIARYAPYWGGPVRKVLVAKSAHELVEVYVAETPQQA